MRDSTLAAARAGFAAFVMPFAVAIAIAMPSSAAAEAPADYAMRQPLATGADKAFFHLELPDSVYDGAARPDLGDLRVFNADGALVPFAFLPRARATFAATPKRPLAIFPLTVDTARADAGDLSINLRKDGNVTSVDIRARDGATVAGASVVAYLVDASGDERPLVALRLALPDDANASARLRIDASDDLAHWRTIVADAPLLSLSYAGRRLTHDRVELPRVAAHYLRLTWLTPSPPMLTAAFGDPGDREIEPARRMRRVAAIADPGDPNVFTFDLGAALPVDRVTLDLVDVNSVVPLRWQARTSAQDPWRDAGYSIVYRLRQERGEVTSAGHPLSGTQLRYFRIAIDPRAGGAGATPPTLVASWYPQQIVFAARGSAPFELAYGSRSAAPGALAIGMLVPGYVAGKPLPANVGEATLATPPSIENRLAMRAPLDVKRALLWTALALASLLLAYMGWRLAQQVRSGDGEARRDM